MTTTATIPNSDIAFRRDRRALVFVHCFLDDQHVWDPVLAGLSAPGFETVQFDQTGFGDPLITAEVVASAIAPRFDEANVTLAEMGQSTHWPHVGRPAAVAGEIDRFLGRME